MTNDEINIAIAEYRNWRNIKEIDYQPFGTDPYIDGPDQMLVGIHPESDSDSDECEPIPNYCKDLNEMHEAEITLSNEIYDEYWNQLVFICTNEGEERMNSASAKLRAKAFVKTIGKWEE